MLRSHILAADVQAQTRQTVDSCVVDKSGREGAADALAAGFLGHGDDDLRDVRGDVSVAVFLVREVAVPSRPEDLLAAAGRAFADEADVPESVPEVVDVGVRSPEGQ